MLIPPLFDTPSNLQAPGFAVTNNAHHTAGDEIENYAAVGETVEYQIVSKNSGNVELSGATVEDPLIAGRGPCVNQLSLPCFGGSLSTFVPFHQNELFGDFIIKSRFSQGANSVLNIGLEFYRHFITLSCKGGALFPSHLS